MRSSSTCRSAGRLILLVWLAAVGSWQSAYAIDPNRALSQYVRDMWTAETGFPGGAVSSIAQTPDGYLWIGCEKGLVRFDGVSFRLVQPSRQSGFANAPVLGLVSDTDGGLWARLQGPVLVHYPRVELLEAMPTEAVPGSLVTAMTRGLDGGLLLASIRRGVLSALGTEFTEIAPRTAMPASFVIAMTQTPSGDLWLGTRDVGLFRLLHGKLTPVIAGVPDRKINCLLSGAGAEVWIGTDTGVVRWNGHEITTAGVPAALAHVQTLAMTRDRDANVWLAAGGGGLVRVSSSGIASIEPRDRRARSGDVTALFEDREGNLWIGSTRGLERLRDAAFTTYAAPEGMPADGGGALLADPSEQRLWFAPPGGGLYTLQDGRVQRASPASLDRDVIYSIAGRGGDLWIGRQQGGLTHLTAAGARTYTQADGLAQNSVYAVYQSRDGAVWAGTLSGGVSRFADGRFVTYTASTGLASNTITAMLESADGTMWFGTSNGLSAFAKGKWTTYHTSDVVPSDAVDCLLEDGNHRLWVGTSAGLAIIEEGRVRSPAGQHGALRDEILGLEADRTGGLWIATSSRVLRVDRDSLRQGPLDDTDVREYGGSDGLLGSEGVKRYRSVLRDARDRIWVSTARALSVVDPARATTAADVPAIAHVQAVAADGVPIAIASAAAGGVARVAPRPQRITISFIGLSLSMPEHVRYRYLLEGFDRSWSEPVAAREAVYTNLGPGPYRFRLRASNSEGRWSETEAAIPFAIDPAFWQTYWFQALAVIIAIASAAALYQIRLRHMAHQLNVRFEERLAERTRIAQELHDTLLQGFVSASMQLHVANEQVPTESPAKPTITRVLDLMARVIEEGRNAVRGLRSTGSSGDDLEQMFHHLQDELSLTTASEFRVIVEGHAQPLHPLVRDEVHRIGREALINAFRHAYARHIEVELEYAAHHLRVLVRDDGAGIDEDVLKSGRQGHWGLSGMRERAEQIGARLRLWSRKGAGTEVELSVPGTMAFVAPPRHGRPSSGRQRWLFGAWLARWRSRDSG